MIPLSAHDALAIRTQASEQASAGFHTVPKIFKSGYIFFAPVERVFNYADGNETTEATIILDGIHRWFAFKEKGIKEIAAVEWKDEPLDYEKNKTTLLLESAECNISHGDRLSPSDKNFNAQRN